LRFAGEQQAETGGHISANDAAAMLLDSYTNVNTLSTQPTLLLAHNEGSGKTQAKPRQRCANGERQ
jgi:hypothetical protein